MPHRTGGLTEALKAHLQAPSLTPLWLALRRRLDRDPALSGTVTVDLDIDGANRLSGLLGSQVPSGTIRVPLEELDEALRGSSANRGLIEVVTELTGAPSTDFATTSQPRSTDSADWSIVWAQLDSQLERTGLAGRSWAQSWASWLQRSGILSQAGVVAAAQSVGHATSALELLERTGVLDPTQSMQIDHPEWELAQLAERTTHNPAGFSEGTLTAALILRAAAFA